MKTKKITPCMDIRGGRVVKGVNFDGIVDVGCPVELAAYYNTSGADELVFYDIGASVEGRGVLADLLKNVKREVTIPLTVAGGVLTVADFDRVLGYGADRVSINTGAIRDKSLIEACAKEFGSGRIVFAMDAKLVDGQYRVFASVGKEDTGIDAMEWIKFGQEHGAGEIVLNSIDTDGVKGGFDLPMLTAASKVATVPVVASGGAGCMEDFLELFRADVADIGLAASIFHRKEVEIGALKRYLAENGVPVRV